MANSPAIELLRRAADEDDEEYEDCEIDPDAVAVLVVCIVLGVALVATGFYLWKRNKLKNQGRAAGWRNILDFGGGKADLQQGGQWDDNMSAFGGSEKAGEWVQQPGSAYGAWGPPPGSHPGSWTGAPSAMPFNQGSDFSQQQQAAYWGGSAYGATAGSGYGTTPGSGYGTRAGSGSGYGWGGSGYIEGSGFSANSGASRSKSKRSRRPEYDDDDASINSYSAYAHDDPPSRKGSRSSSKRKGSYSRKHSY